MGDLEGGEGGGGVFDGVEFEGALAADVFFVFLGFVEVG